MANSELKEAGYFEEVADLQGQFRIVTTHHYPWGALMGWVGIKPLTEKWERGNLDTLAEKAAQLKSSEIGYIGHPVELRFAEENVRWEREQGQTLGRAIQVIGAKLERKRLEDLYPMKSLGDPVI